MYSPITEYLNKIQSNLDELVSYAEDLEVELRNANDKIKELEKELDNC